ncbi:hypothetical protein L1987_52075 [Smallanthus sonchifolius]|uniref:Uncharacterized protein n=1 Tax=Smallanthus sonchifolius TaxID=185202 RepID=A0ACB9ERT6_9ASTR|nr:hypothetical protein L1987_52075 [Smallanthus sonchifolius]
MGKPKTRWTSEEETALFAGVNKYGTGKWKDILTDKQFAHCLIKRSNVDLKVYIYLLHFANMENVEAASYADNVKVLMAGSLLHYAEKACKEVERLEKVSEESAAILQMAGEL